MECIINLFFNCLLIQSASSNVTSDLWSPWADPGSYSKSNG